MIFIYTLNYIHSCMPITHSCSTCLLQSDGGGVHTVSVLRHTSVGGVVVSGDKVHSEGEVGVHFLCSSEQHPIHTPGQVKGGHAVGATGQGDGGAQNNWVR